MCPSLDWVKLAKRVGVPYRWLRAQLDPDWAETMLSSDRQRRAYRKNQVRQPIMPPADTRDFTARFMGDPVPGRSALARRTG